MGRTTVRIPTAQIAQINGSGGLKDTYTYNDKAATKYKNRPVDGIQVGGCMYFTAPRVCTIDNQLSYYRRYLTIITEENRQFIEEHDRDVLLYVNIDMQNTRTDHDAALIERYLGTTAADATPAATKPADF